VSRIYSELKHQYEEDKNFRDSLINVPNWLDDNRIDNDDEFREQIWKVFFPEGVGIFGNETGKIKSLRVQRKIKITSLNPNPIVNPGKQIIFTSNVLLSLPPISKSIDELQIDDTQKNKFREIKKEKQKYWFDHPVQIGVAPENNEILYGLKALNEAVEFEKKRGNVEKNAKVICLLSISVTHDGLHEIAGHYLHNELEKNGGLNNLTVYTFSETDTKKIIDEVLIPVAEKNNITKSKYLHEVFGVDGKYGRHYSFLKAISAFWNVFIDTEIKATFKIDLDQVFPQEKLIKETGLSAFEHFKTPLWGAKGEDIYGNSLELGMIAGALVNHDDIEKSLFTPDVTFPNRKINGDEYIFFSKLPQALSTRAEMMTKYNDSEYDVKSNCINRIHVTGGTNGILVDALKKHKPFTPSFIGRAEDQAY
ncbi:MAG: hypothetical protein KAR38_17805, partial [Calditrichia bacterium]|nr:hypothetical protein [Calditrichia bacterium]